MRPVIVRASTNLGDLLDHEVVPRLSVEDIFTDPAHAWRERGKTWKGGCPWHSSKSGSSFTVNPETLQWNCAGGCGGGGPVQYLWRKRGGAGRTPRGADFVEMVKELAGLAGVPFPEREVSEEEREKARVRETRRSVLDVVFSRASEVLWSPAGEAALAYLRTERGFTDEEVRALGLGYYDMVEGFREALEKAGVDVKDAVDAAVLRPKLEGFIVVPWRDDRGRPLTVYGRWKEKVPPLQKDLPAWKVDRDRARAEWEARKASGAQVAEWTEPEVPKTTALRGDETKASPLYFDRARAAGVQELVLVEGVFDAALLQVRGDPRVVAAVGAQATKLQVETLVRNRVKTVFICGDPDGGGDAGTLNNIRSLTAAGIPTYVVPRLPDGLDPDEFLLRDGLDAWKERVSRSIAGSVFKATLHLQGVTPTSPDKVKREAVDVVLSDLETVTGPKAALDHEEILRAAADHTGYTVEALAEIAAAHEAEAKKRQATTAVVKALEQAKTTLERGDAGSPEDPFAVARNLSKTLSSLSSEEEPEAPWFDEERLWDELGEVPSGRLSGWDALDGIGVRFHAGELGILGARPGHAKTSVLAGLLWNWLRAAGPDEVFLFYSYEEPERQLYRRLLSLASVEAAAGRAAWGRDDIRYFRVEPESRDEWPPLRLLEAARHRLAPMRNRFAVIRKPAWTAEELAVHALRQKERGLRVSGVFVDYLQLIREPKGGADRPDIALSITTQRLKDLAVELDAPVVAGAQMGRASIPPNFSANVASAGSYEEATATIRTARPDLQHLRGGGIEHAADLVLGLLNYRADYREAASKAKDIPAVTLLEVGTLKAREGSPGLWSPLAFEGRYGLVRDMTEAEEETLAPEEPPSRREVARVREEGRAKRSAESLERERLRGENLRTKLELEQVKSARTAPRKPTKARTEEED